MAKPSLLQRPMPLFEERTAAGDLGWVEQALALGFTPLAEVRANVPWVLVAVETDRSEARVAQRLVQEMVNHTLADPAHQDDLCRLLANSMNVAIEHGNAPFLGVLEPIVEALTDSGKTAFVRHLMLGVHRLTSYRELLWARLVNIAGQSVAGDKDPQAWAWVPSIPGYDPSIWTDPSLGLRALVASRLTHAVWETSTIFRTRRFLEQMGVEPFLGNEPDLIDTAMSPWRDHAPLDRWVLNNDKRFTRTQELKALIDILRWAARRGAPTSTLAGHDLVAEASGWADQLAQRSDELVRFAPMLREAVMSWETMALHQTVKQTMEGVEAAPRTRTRL